MDGWAGVNHRGGQQYGALHVRHGRRHGISEDALLARAKREGWRRPHLGVVLLPGAADCYEQRVSAAIQVVGGQVAVARWSALYLHDIVDKPPPFVHLVLPAGRRAPRLVGVRFLRSRTIERGDVEVVKRLPTTTMVRTVADLASPLDRAELRDVLMRGRQRRRLSTSELLAYRVCHPNMVGGPTLDHALADVSEELADSSFEYAMRDLYCGGGLRPHPSPFPFRCPDGVVIRLDLAFPWAWVATECDSRGFHSDVAPFNADRVRWSQAIQGGWALTWATWDRLSRDPAGLLADVRALLARADRSRAPALPAL